MDKIILYFNSLISLLECEVTTFSLNNDRNNANIAKNQALIGVFATFDSAIGQLMELRNLKI